MDSYTSSDTRLLRCDKWLRWPDHEEHSLEFLRILAVADDGGSTVRDCFAAADGIIPGNDESWYLAWLAAGQACRERAEVASDAGNGATARANWLRASNYFRTAETFLRIADPRRAVTIEAMRSSSKRYLETLDIPGETVRIPIGDGASVDCYYLRAPGPGSRAPVVVCIGGWDDFKDEQLTTLPRHALDRGLSVLLIELPKPGGTGKAAPSRAFDVPSAIEHCVDYLVRRADVDERLIAIYGDGIGASFATQAAALDFRYKAAVCDGGKLDLARRALTLQQLFGGEDDSVALSHLRRRWPVNHVGCPMLVPVSEEDWLAAIRSAGGRFPVRTDANVSLQFSTPDATSSDPRICGAPISNEYVFDWIADRFAEAGGAAGPSAT